MHLILVMEGNLFGLGMGVEVPEYCMMLAYKSCFGSLSKSSGRAEFEEVGRKYHNAKIEISRDRGNHGNPDPFTFGKLI